MKLIFSVISFIIGWGSDSINQADIMRILLNYDYQYFPFTTATYLEYALRKRPELHYFRTGQDRTPCADLIINVEPCSTIIAYPTAVSCFWEIDNHIHRGGDIEKYDKVKYLFVTQKHFLKLYPSEKTHLLPLAVDPDVHKLYPEEPILYDVGFLGNDTYPERRDLLDRIGAKYKLLRETSKPGEEYSRKLSQCKLLFNRSMDHDLNMRVFEAISIGRMLLTDKVEGMDDLFKDGEHYISYTGWDDLDKKINAYLTHPEEREKIARQGRDYIAISQTYDQRLDDILHITGFY